MARGFVSVVSETGETTEYEHVQVTHTGDRLVLSGSRESGMTETLTIQKAQCVKDGGVQFCSGGTVSLEHYRVTEVIQYTNLAVYTNTGSTPAQVPGTLVTLGPNTFMLELKTVKGTYISAFGEFDR
ncbi:hypothetical protein RYO59_001326 [Thermosynechococcaceae cyanobacterium Okahandja]